MKKLILNLLSLIFIMSFSTNSNAEQINQSKASAIAQNFLSKINTSITTQSNNRLTLAYTAKSVSNPTQNCFYVFNKGIKDGFIIVAADDCVLTEVLGYCNYGEYDNNNLPANFKWWIDQYQREIDYAIKNRLSTTSTIQPFATSVSPLLGNIAWNQGDPYNLLCPTLTNASGETERTVTGCVATATAQVMRYYKWPAKGTGSNSYTWEKGGKTLSVDFSKSTYDWDNMTETYNSNSSTTEKNAVAKLMYDCGVSCNMEYNLSSAGGSAASAYDQVEGLYNYFGYDLGMEHLTRDYYKLTDWNSIIKKEIDNSRPILYRGTGSGGGHAFIIDGYNASGYFHFNWGWGGSSDGYFVTTALNPGELGIGGGAGGYNYNQGMTIGIQPAQASSTETIEMTNDGLQISGDATNGFKIIISKLANRNWIAATFDLGLFVESSTGVTKILQLYSNTTLNPLYYYNPISVSTSTFGSYFADGTYKVYLGIKASNSSSWEEIPTLIGSAKYVYVTISGGAVINVTYDQASLPNLSVVGYELNDKIYANRVATISTTVKNSGSEYLGDMAIVFADANGNILANSGLLMTDILEGETKELLFEYSMISLAEGVSITTATPCVMYLFGNASSESIFNIGRIGNATLYPVGSGSPALAFTKQPKVNSSTEDNVSITLGLINNGTIFKDAITFYTWDRNLENSFCGGISQYAMIENKESKDITFSFPYNGIVGHTYLVNIYANNAIIKGNTASINYTCSFTLQEGAETGVENIKTNVEMMVVNTNNMLEITAEHAISQINIYNTAGVNVAHQDYNEDSNIETISLESQPKGVYVIKVETTDGTKTSKIIIK